MFSTNFKRSLVPELDANANALRAKSLKTSKNEVAVEKVTAKSRPAVDYKVPGFIARDEGPDVF